MNLSPHWLRSKWIQVGLITMAFAVIYPLVRSLPDTKCEFLHYNYVGETPDGTEYCGTEVASFIDLTRLSFPVDMKLLTTEEIKKGNSVFLTVEFVNSDGYRLRESDLAVVHDEKIHLLIIDPSLLDYHHLHPEPMGPAGQFGFDFVPHRSGTYRIFAEIVPLASRTEVVCLSEIVVPGQAEPQRAVNFPDARWDDYRFKLELLTGVQPVTNTDVEIRLQVERSENSSESTVPIPFEKVMGTYAHMVAFDTGRRGMAHMHPLDDGVALDSSNPEFGFILNTSLPADYRIWAQFRIEGRDVYVPFDLSVKES